MTTTNPTTVANVAKRYIKAATQWLKPVTYGTGTSKTVGIKSADGRMALRADTVYHKPSGSAGVGVKGKYLLKWEIVDRWTPNGSFEFTYVPVVVGKYWTYDRKTALKVAEAYLQRNPMEAPLPGSLGAKDQQQTLETGGSLYRFRVDRFNRQGTLAQR